MKNTKEEQFAERYRTAMQTCLAQDPDQRLVAARRLGRQALKLHLTVQNLALIHEQALALVLCPANKSMVVREALQHTGQFFRQVLAPVLKGDKPPPVTKQAGKTSRPPAASLVAANKKYKEEYTRRVTAEAALKESEKHHVRLLSEAQAMHEQMRHLSHQILIVQEDERKRISRELHDEIGQVLTGINVQLATLEIQAVSDTKGIRRKIAKTQRLVEKSVESIHRFARQLRPSMLDDLGLIPTLRSFIQELGKRKNLETHLSATKDARIKDLSSLERTVLYRIAQEALTNVTKHAKATSVTVSLQIDLDTVCLSIRDDGKSFNVNRALGPERRRRLGIIGMRERAEMVNGTFSIESVKGKGTNVCVRLPLPPGKK